MLRMNTGQIKADVRKATRYAVEEGLVVVGKTALARTPKDSGDLRNSQHTEATSAGSVVTGEISYNIIYANRQHEETGWTHPRGGQAKYLESAARDEETRVRSIIQNRLGGM